MGLRGLFFFGPVLPRLVHLLLHGSYRVRASASVRLVRARHQVFFGGLALRQIFPPLGVALLDFVDVLVARDVVQRLALRAALAANRAAAVRAKRPAHRRLLQSMQVLPWSIPPDRRGRYAPANLPTSDKAGSYPAFVLPRNGSAHHSRLHLLASNTRGVAVVRPARVRLRPRSGSLTSQIVSGDRDGQLRAELSARGLRGDRGVVGRRTARHALLEVDKAGVNRVVAEPAGL